MLSVLLAWYWGRQKDDDELMKGKNGTRLHEPFGRGDKRDLAKGGPFPKVDRIC